MKQTKKLTRNQRAFLSKKKFDPFEYRLIEDRKDVMIIQKISDGSIVNVSK